MTKRIIENNDIILLSIAFFQPSSAISTASRSHPSSSKNRLMEALIQSSMSSVSISFSLSDKYTLNRFSGGIGFFPLPARMKCADTPQHNKQINFRHLTLSGRLDHELLMPSLFHGPKPVFCPAPSCSFALTDPASGVMFF